MLTVLKVAQLRCTSHVIRMPDEQLLKKKFSTENYRRESALEVANTTKTLSKPQRISIDRGLINKGAALY